MPARFDAQEAPHDDLLQMRRATAHFARILNNLRDEDINRYTEIRLVIAKVSLHARQLALSAKEFRTGLSDEEKAYSLDVKLAATLPVAALRHLFTHSALHLNVELRDLEDQHWIEMQNVPSQRSRSLSDASEFLSR